jgi:hypothetical protein
VPRRRVTSWRDLAALQAGVLARRQLLSLGYGARYVDGQLAAQRWQLVSDVVVCTTTGPLHRSQLMWAGVLHAGPNSAIAGLTALEVRGLRRWHRDEVTVLLPKSRNLEPLSGVRFVETRRPVMLFATGAPQVWRTEPAALLFAGYHPSTRTALGLLAAVVQQRLTSADRLLHELPHLHPVRRSRVFRSTLEEIARGSQSVNELDLVRLCHREGLPLPDRQTPRRDGSGRLRYTDAEWRLRDGRVVILEIDGGFHMEVEHWEDDIVRERDLVTTGAIVLRCTGRELRDESSRVAASLRAVGVGRSSA